MRLVAGLKLAKEESGDHPKIEMFFRSVQNMEVTDCESGTKKDGHAPTKPRSITILISIRLLTG